MIHYKLIDELNYNEVVKDDDGKRYIYCFGAEKWVRSGIMVRYMWPDDIKYDQYTIISEEAMKLLNKQRDHFNLLLELAIEIATKAHNGQVDKGGNPYILHPKAVADDLESTENKIVAYLHDVYEDSNITFNDLQKMGFSKRIVNSIRILTKTKDVSYEDYIKSVKKDSNAWHVKMSDLKHNMDLTRIPNCTEKDYARVEKYKKALNFLKN